MAGDGNDNSELAIRSDAGDGAGGGTLDRSGDRDSGSGRAVALNGESAALISMIERAARDPNVDIDKMERLFTMKERAEASIARRAFDAAFALMQPDLPEIDKKGKIIIKEKGTDKVIQSTPYALWEDTNRLIKPILAKHGFGLSFRITQTDARITTTAVLSHCEGHRETTDFSSPIDATGSKNNVQGWGSSFSYGKRYTGTALLNITTKGEDDDGKAAAAPATITDEQAEQIKVALEETGGLLPRFCAYWKLEKLTDLPAEKFGDALASIKGRKRTNG